jgi:hypothetical protein
MAPMAEVWRRLGQAWFPLWPDSTLVVSAVAGESRVSLNATNP